MVWLQEPPLVYNVGHTYTPERHTQWLSRSATTANANENIYARDNSGRAFCRLFFYHYYQHLFQHKFCPPSPRFLKNSGNAKSWLAQYCTICYNHSTNYENSSHWVPGPCHLQLGSPLYTLSIVKDPPTAETRQSGMDYSCRLESSTPEAVKLQNSNVYSRGQSSEECYHFQA